MEPQAKKLFWLLYSANLNFPATVKHTNEVTDQQNKSASNANWNITADCTIMIFTG